MSVTELLKLLIAENQLVFRLISKENRKEKIYFYGLYDQLYKN